MILPRSAFVGHMNLESHIILLIVIMGVMPVLMLFVARLLRTPMQPLQAVFCKNAIPWLFLALVSRTQGNRVELRLTRLLQ